MMSKLVGIIGWPVTHSLSPLMHNAAFKKLQLDQWLYVYLPVAKQPDIRIKEAISGLRALGFNGANVTVPYKETVIPFLDELSATAQAVRSVNTIVVDPSGKLVGHTTDGDGFINDLFEHGILVKDKIIMLLGAGGSARSLAYALLQQGCKKLILLNRTESKAHAIAQAFAPFFPNTEIVVGTLEEAATREKADVIINATTIGMAPAVHEMPWPKEISFTQNQVVYDIIYHPQKTMLLKKAEYEGVKAINGLGMLVHQGALAFTLWTGCDAPIKYMQEIVREKMK